MSEPIASADALVAAIDPGLSSPGVESRDLVLVTGPWLAGTSSLIAGLRDQMPDHTFVEADDLGPTDAPVAVVFVVSALALLTESDCALIDLAVDYTDLIVGVVSKIDAHRNWRDVLAADRVLLAARTPRYRHVQWVGTAAAPDLGEPMLDELVGLLRQRLADPDLRRRNRLRTWETRLQSMIGRYQADGAGTDRQARVTALRKNRDDILRGRRLSKSEHAISLRSRIQQARVQLTYFARNRCTSVRGELQEDVSSVPRRRLGQFEGYVRTRAGEVVDEVDEGITTHLGDMAGELGLPAPPLPAPPPRPEVSAPPVKSRRLETQLMMILGAGFGLGVAVVVTRLFAGLAPGLTIAGLVAGGLVGLCDVWVVGIRGLLHDRAVLDRWIADAAARAFRGRGARRDLRADRRTALTSELAARDEAERATAAERIEVIDAELREHAVAAARAAAVRDCRLPPVSVRSPLSEASSKFRRRRSPGYGSAGTFAPDKAEPAN